MSRLVFDIETSGKDFDTLDEKMQDYLLRFADTPERIEEEKLKVNLYPYTAEVVCVGMLNVDSMQAKIFYRGEKEEGRWTSADGNVEYIPGSEIDVLHGFWNTVAKFEQLISFNGRGFDGPFMHIRSAMLGVRPTRNLVPYRYDSSKHCDLLDQMSYYGAYRKFSLDFICTAFGIESPKRQGVTGLDVNDLFRQGDTRSIAEYNYRDLIATRELYLRWDEFMNRVY